MAKTNNPQEHREPKTVALQTHILSIALTFVFTLIVGTITGYFVAISIHENARATVVSDIQLVSKAK